MGNAGSDVSNSETSEGECGCRPPSLSCETVGGRNSPEGAIRVSSSMRSIPAQHRTCVPWVECQHLVLSRLLSCWMHWEKALLVYPSNESTIFFYQNIYLYTAKLHIWTQEIRLTLTENVLLNDIYRPCLSPSHLQDLKGERKSKSRTRGSRSKRRRQGRR